MSASSRPVLLDGSEATLQLTYDFSVRLVQLKQF